MRGKGGLGELLAILACVWFAFFVGLGIGHLAGGIRTMQQAALRGYAAYDVQTERYQWVERDDSQDRRHTD